MPGSGGRVFSEEDASLLIQGQFRRRQASARVQGLREDRAMNTAAMGMQAQFRGRKSRQRVAQMRAAGARWESS